MTKWLQQREVVVLALLVALIAVIGVINNSFLEPKSLLSMLNTSLILMLLATGEMFVILTRGIDVSVGAMMGLAAVVLGLALNAGMSLWLAIPLTLLVGLALGAINGVGVAVVRIPPIIMTLGALGVYRGAMLILTGGSWIETIPQSIKTLAGMKVFEVSVFAIATLLIILLTTFLLRHIRQARYFYYVGDNEDGAFMLGIPVRPTQTVAYALSGLFAGAAAVIFVGQIGFVPMQTGYGQELNAIAAGVLGGINLSGGVGTPISALIGALFLTVINSALVFLKVPAFWNNAIAGAILLIVVLIDFRVRVAVEARQRQQRAHVRHETSATIQPLLSPEEAS